jgi:hypothetical protein
MCYLCEGPQWTGKIRGPVLEQVKQELGLKWPVRIQINKNMPSSHRGRAKIEAGVFEHLIQLSPDMTVLESTFTLLHELRHCHQYELGVNKTGTHNTVIRALRFANDTYGYKDNPFEVDANNFAKKWEHLNLTF